MKIYLAAPIFTTTQIAVVAGIKLMAERRDHEIFSPYHNSKEIFRGRKPADCSPRERQQVLTDNIVHLDWCDVLLAWVGGMGGFTDPGVVWEMGHAYANGKFQVAYADPAETRQGMNLMLAGTIDAFTLGPDELTYALSHLDSAEERDTIRDRFSPDHRLAADKEPVV